MTQHPDTGGEKKLLLFQFLKRRWVRISLVYIVLWVLTATWGIRDTERKIDSWVSQIMGSVLFIITIDGEGKLLREC